MKKILALVCALVMMVSVFASFTVVSHAAVSGATVTLEFAGYETAGTTTFAKVDVKLAIPDTLVAYEAVEPDWENTFEYTYKGKMLQGVAIDVPYVEGLQFIKAKSTVAPAFAAAGLAVNANATASTAQVVYANTSTDYSTYYAGELGTIATLWYRITGDVNGTYTLAASNAVVGVSTVVEATGALNNAEYKFADFTTTPAVVKPAGPSVQADKKEKPVTITANEITLNDIKYTNVAVFNASHTLTLKDGENITEAGIEVNDTSVLTFPALAGETGGTIEYNAIIYGVTGDLKVETYFAGNFFPEV